jgi:hypothetical protein
MKRPLSINSSQLVAVSLTLSIGSVTWSLAQRCSVDSAQASPAVNNRQSNQLSYRDTQQYISGEPKFTATFREGAGIKITLMPTVPGFPSQAYLIKINNTTLSGLNQEQIGKLLTGKNKLHLVSEQGEEISVYASPYEQPTPNQDSDREAILANFSSKYNGASSVFENALRANNLKDDEFFSNTLMAEADANELINLAEDDKENSDASLSETLTYCTSTQLTMGMIPVAKKNLQRLIELQTKQKTNDTLFNSKLREVYEKAVACGLDKEAEGLGWAVCRGIVGSSSKQSQREPSKDDEELLFVRAFAGNLAKTSPKDALKLLEDCGQIAGRNPQSFPWQGPLNWNAEFYATCGNYKRASQEYEKSLKEFTGPTLPSGPQKYKAQEINALSRYNYILLRLSELALKLDQIDKSVEYLEQSRDSYLASLKPEMLPKLEELPLLCPTPRLINYALIESYLRKGDADSKRKAEKLLEETLADKTRKQATTLTELRNIQNGGWRKEFYFPESTFTNTDVFARELNKLYEKLENTSNASIAKDNNNISLKSAIESLVNKSTARNFVYGEGQKQIDYYSCLFYLAKELAASGHKAESIVLFEKLKGSASALKNSPYIKLPIELEIAAITNNFSKLDEMLKPVSHWSEVTPMRGLANIYIATGETDKAEKFLAHAEQQLQEQESVTVSAQNQSGERVIQAQLVNPLIALDRCKISALDDDISKLMKQFNKSIFCIDAIRLTAPSSLLDSFNQKYLNRIIEIINIVNRKGHRDKAIEICSLTIEKMNDKSCWLGVFQNSASSINLLRPQAHLKASLGILLFEAGEQDKALPYLKTASSELKDWSTRQLLLTLAKCAYAKGDFAEASQAYSNLAKNSYFPQAISSPRLLSDLRKTYAREAIASALKAKDFPAEQLSRLYKELAEMLDAPNEVEERAVLYKRALALSDPDSEIAKDLSLKIARFETTPSDSKLRIDLLARASNVAIRRNSPDAAQLQIGLANEEIQGGQFDNAVKNYLEAIRHIQRKADKPKYCDQIFSSQPWGSLHQLSKAGRGSAVETIYLALLDKAKELYGAKSAETKEVLSLLIPFYAEKGNLIKASNYLESYLEIDPRKIELGTYNTYATPSRLEETFVALAKKASTAEFSKTALNKLLARTKVYYGSDDIHVARILASQAKLEVNCGNLVKAELLAKEAQRIEELYGAVNTLGLGYSPSKSLLFEIYSKQDNKAKLAALDEYYKERSKESEKHWSLVRAATSKQKQEYLNYWRQISPYQPMTIAPQYQMLNEAYQAKNWQQIKQDAPWFLRTLAHNSLFLSGGCISSPSPATQKYFCYKALIEACQNTNDRSSALNWLQQANSEKCYNSSVEELLFLAKIEYLCGNKDRTRELCKEAKQEATAKKLPQYANYQYEIAELMKMAGSEQEQKQTAEQQELLMYQNQVEMYRQYANSKQKENQSSLVLKKPPIRQASSIDNIIPATPVSFPQDVKQGEDRYSLNYAILCENLVLENGALVKRNTQQGGMFDYSFAGAFKSLKASQPIHKAGSFQFLFDGGNLIVPQSTPTPNIPWSGGTGAGGSTGALFNGPVGTAGGGYMGGLGYSAPPTVMPLPLKPALEAPAKARRLDSTLEELVPQEGDYIADSLDLKSLIILKTRKIRIFISPKSTAPIVLRTDIGASINSEPNWLQASRAGLLEFWYDGNGEINLGDYTAFSGIIYAPKARIRLGKNCQFTGAMVAKDVIVGENSVVTYAASLAQWQAMQK